MNAIVVTVNETPASRLRAFAAAQLAATQHRPLHLVFGVSNVAAKFIHVGADSFFVGSFDVADRVLDDLTHELRRIVTVTHSVVAKRPTAAVISEARRLDASQIFGAGTPRSRRFNRRQEVRRSALASHPQGVLNQSPVSEVVAFARPAV